MDLSIQSTISTEVYYTVTQTGWLLPFHNYSKQIGIRLEYIILFKIIKLSANSLDFNQLISTLFAEAKLHRYFPAAKKCEHKS